MYLDLSHGSLPRMLRSGILVEPGTLRPRYWSVVWCAIFAGDFSENTRIGKLRAIEALYQHAEVLHGSGALDDALGRLDHEVLAEILESWFVSIRNRPVITHADEQRWQMGLRFVSDIVRWSSKGQPSTEKFHRIEERLLRLNQLYRQLHIKKRTHVELIRSLPASVIESLYAVLDPEASCNPFFGKSMRWRIYIAFILMLHQGLRRGELLLLPVDCIKAGFDKRLGRERYWINVRSNEYEDGSVDSRYSKPSIKNASSIRQIPVSAMVSKHIQVYIENYRGRPEHPYLLNSKWNNPLSTESLTKAFSSLASALPKSVLQELEDRTGKSNISPHDLRHTCAVVRLQQLLDQGDSMDEALQKLRNFFGWSKTSVMPLRYARAVFEDRLSNVWNDAFDDRIEVLRAIPKG